MDRNGRVPREDVIRFVVGSEDRPAEERACTDIIDDSDDLDIEQIAQLDDFHEGAHENDLSRRAHLARVPFSDSTTYESCSCVIRLKSGRVISKSPTRSVIGSEPAARENVESRCAGG